MTKDEEIQSLRITLEKWQKAAYEVGEHRDLLIKALNAVYGIVGKTLNKP